ncbi:Subtilisin-like protease SBT2.5 [Camellia lanceoleosa]|nr:Subtilisin-like protease SBT2.5 [Camellia lanceoleosa]
MLLLFDSIHHLSMQMQSIFFLVLLVSSINTWFLQLMEAKVFVVLMEDNPRSDEDAVVYKERLISGHDIFLDSVLQRGSYIKLYSYTHLLNGFAVHITSEKVLDTIRNANGVKAIHEDIKMKKFTTHTPDFLGIPTGVWPTLGGAGNSGEGVVIGFIDTGINPNHPSFTSRFPITGNSTLFKSSKFKGKCNIGEQFPSTACNGKIVGAHYFARAAIVNGEFNATRDYASPFDADGHGSHTASTAAGNHLIPVVTNNFNYGYASGMAPAARISVYKALYPFGGYMSDVVAAVDQAVEDGVDILSLSIGPSSVPPGPSAFLNLLEMVLLFATKAGVFVVQAAGNGGPSSSSILSFSPWITSVAACITDRKYNNSIQLGDGQRFTGAGLAPPTTGEILFPIAAAADVSQRNTTAGLLTIESCQNAEPFVPSLVRGKLIICTYTFDFDFESASIATVADTIHKVGAAGFILCRSWQEFALVSGTSMATPHIAGVAALIKQKHPHWNPSAITSAMMTTADVTDPFGAPILAQQTNKLTPGTPFDFGSGSINPSRAIDPGLVFNTYFNQYMQFLCDVPGVDDMSVRRAVGVGCPSKRKAWCSDLNTASVTISSLVGSRKVIRKVTNVGDEAEKYKVVVKEPLGVKVSVVPKVFKISVNASRNLNLVLEATKVTNAYTFGEMVLEGDRKHVVRVPIAVYVSSSIGS